MNPVEVNNDNVQTMWFTSIEKILDICGEISALRCSMASGRHRSSEQRYNLKEPFLVGAVV